jgi:hypothetical protein
LPLAVAEVVEVAQAAHHQANVPRDRFAISLTVHAEVVAAVLVSQFQPCAPLT